MSAIAYLTEVVVFGTNASLATSAVNLTEENAMCRREWQFEQKEELPDLPICRPEGDWPLLQLRWREVTLVN